MRRARWLLSVTLLVSGCLADLRPEALVARESPAAPASARALLTAAAAAQSPGGRDWRAVSGVTVELEDDWSGFTGFVVRPWPNDPQRLRLSFRPARDEGLLELCDADGAPGRTWGLHGWNAWRRDPGEPAEYRDDDEALFWLPTLAYFLEGTLRLGREAGLVDLAGAAECAPGPGEAAQPCDRVYVTWGGYPARGDLDQYLAWVRRSDGLIVRLDFTVRDVARFVTASAFYQDWREVSGFLLPHRVVIGDAPDDPLHVLTVRQWTLDRPLPPSRLAPEARPPRAKPPA